jgi:hypothetical protein
MTRKLPCGLLLCFVQLTILPGCQSFPYFGSTASEGPKKIYERRDAMPPDASKGVAGEVTMGSDADNLNDPLAPKNQLNSTIAKIPQGPSFEAWLAQQETADRKKRSEGATGIVTVEASPQPERPRNGGVKAPPPLPLLTENKREYAPLVQAIQCMLDERHEEALKHLRAYDDATQQFFLRLLPPLTVLVKKRVEDLSPQEVAVLIDQIDALRLAFLHRSELVVSKMCYCKRVKNYGSYEALPDNHAFLTGTQTRIGEQVQLYVELKNFESKPTKEGDFLTKLACSLELHDANTGKKVWSKSIDGAETTHRRRSRINDFCCNYSFYVPAIPAGTYQLTLHIADETTPEQRRLAHKSLVFVATPVADQPSLR